MPSPACEIRMAKEGDIDALTAIYCSSADYHQGLDAEFYTTPDPSAVREAFRRAFTSADAAIFAAEKGGDVVGYVEVNLLKPPDPASMIRPRSVADIGIAVLPAYRGRRIGEALMLAAEAWAFERGADGILLNCHASNASAIRFYQRLGYRMLGYVMEKSRQPN